MAGYAPQGPGAVQNVKRVHIRMLHAVSPNRHFLRWKPMECW